MSKKVLFLSVGKPEKGQQTDLLCDEFMRGAAEAGHEAEKIRLEEKEINYCTGCCACIGNQGACVQQDDMNDIFTKILAADGLVLATPVYLHAMNAPMKTFIDSTCPIYSMVRDKEVYYIAAAAGGQIPVDRAVKNRHIYPFGLDKFFRFATEIWGIKAEGKTKDAIAKEGLNALENFLKAYGIVTSLKALGATREMLPKIAESTFILENR